jgi:spermidine synthase
MGVRDFSRRELIFIALFMGFSSGIIQVLLIRELLSLCRGNELIIGMIFSSWFLGIYIGARSGSSASTASLAMRVKTSLFMLPALVAVSVYSAHVIQVFLPRPVGGFYSFSAEVLISFLTTVPVSFFVGFFFPPLVALVSDEVRERSGGTVFYVESAGSFAGALVFSFLLVELANPLAISCMLMIVALAVVFIKNNRRRLLLIFFPMILIIFSADIEKKVFAYVWEKNHTGKLVQYGRTKYQTVSVESYGDTISVYGDGILMYTLPDRHETRGLFHLVQSLRDGRRSVLLHGSGPGSLLHNLLRTGIELRYFETDPELWLMLHPYVNALYQKPAIADPPVSGMDLKHFLTLSDAQFDMIISIPSEPGNVMLNRFYTQDFYSLCKQHLTETGIFITSLHGFSNYMSPALRDYMASIYAAFANEFPVHLKTSGETMYLIGAKANGVLPGNVDAHVRGYAAAKPADGPLFERELVENYSADELKMFFEKTQLDYFDRTIAPLAKTVDANRDMKPGAYWKNILFSAFKEQSVLYAMIRGYLLLPIVILMLSAAALWDIRRRYGTGSFMAGLQVFLTGFISISTMFNLILLYQNTHGIVYYRISLMNALFMLGLAAGSFVFTRAPVLKLHHVYAGIAASLILVLVYTAYETWPLFWALILICSFTCGSVFPLLFTSVGSTDYFGTASVLDSMDHCGAIAGSLLSAASLVPLLGIQGTVVLNLILVIPAFLTGIIGFRRK